MINHKKFKLHFVGIGGIGMSGIAEIFLIQGHSVSGSDLNLNETCARLKSLGAKISIGHVKENVSDCDVVVISSAVKADNPEVKEARLRNIPVIPRAECLAEIMRGKTGVAIAGTHGKTTTTSMTAQILMQAGLDPTVVVGGKVEAIGSNAKLGEGDIIVVEADESDGSFHLLPAHFGVITNIDLDHMEFYHTHKNLNDAFIKFVAQMPFFGCTWVCGDDAGVREVISNFTKPYQTYGIEEYNDLVAKNIVITGLTQKFEVIYQKKLLGEVELAVLGKHNILNALAAIGVSMNLGASFDSIKTALKNFKHVRRRFDERYYSKAENLRLIDDYGHHPTEVRAVLATTKQVGHARIMTVFQPHRYTRTKLCWNEFLSCFKDSDVLVMLPIYSAGELEISGVSSHELCKDIRKSLPKLMIIEANNLDEALEFVIQNKKHDDLILTLGAGTVTKLSEMLREKLS